MDKDMQLKLPHKNLQEVHDKHLLTKHQRYVPSHSLIPFYTQQQLD